MSSASYITVAQKNDTEVDSSYLAKILVLFKVPNLVEEVSRLAAKPIIVQQAFPVLQSSGKLQKLIKIIPNLMPKNDIKLKR